MCMQSRAVCQRVVVSLRDLMRASILLCWHLMSRELCLRPSGVREVVFLVYASRGMEPLELVLACLTSN
jgi:hypothetical protein